MTIEAYGGLQKIGHGTSRNVYKIIDFNIPEILSDYVADDVVVKEAKRRFGYESNCTLISYTF